MTEEERQRQMDFILEHQSHFVQRFERDENRLERVERVAKLIVRAGLRARREMREQDERITALINSQIRTEDAMRETRDAMREVSENLTRTEEIAKLNSESISQLSEIVRQLATQQNGNGSK